MFVMDYYGHKLSNGVLFAHHLILDVPGGSSHLGYRRRVPLGHNPPTRVKHTSRKMDFGIWGVGARVTFWCDWWRRRRRAGSSEGGTKAGFS